MYDDMLDIEYPFSLNHKRMSNYDRCSQFMPFSALTGYKEAVLEMARITDRRIFLDEESKKILDDKVSIILSKSFLKINVTITYFVPDMVKSGGSYRSVCGTIDKVDLYNRNFVVDNNKIFIDDIVDIDSEIFKEYCE